MTPAQRAAQRIAVEARRIFLEDGGMEFNLTKAAAIIEEEWQRGVDVDVNEVVDANK